MIARNLLKQGEVRAAQGALSEWLRSHPGDHLERTFLFELLCFSGDWDRAERQLSVLAKGDPQKELGAILYFSALHAERTRHDLATVPALQADSNPPSSLLGTLNGRPFQSISDADPNIGARLEIFAAGCYAWLALEHVASIRFAAPRRLRDTLWAEATVQTNSSFHGGELREVLVPVLYPFSWKAADQSVWLGHRTVWAEEQGEARPFGQKMLLVDDEEIPLLDVRELAFTNTAVAADA